MERYRLRRREHQYLWVPVIDKVGVWHGAWGVGKTTSSAAFAAGLAMRGHKTVVIDFDVGLRNLDLMRRLNLDVGMKVPVALPANRLLVYPVWRFLVAVDECQRATCLFGGNGDFVQIYGSAGYRWSFGWRCRP